MKNILNSVLIMFLVIFTFTPTILAQDSPQWHLPDRAKTRYGKGTVREIKYSPDGTMMAVASAIGIWIYDVQTTEALYLLAGHTREVRSIDFNADGTQIVSGSVDKTVRVWDVAMGIEVNMFTGHTETVSSVAFSPDGKILASADSNGTIRVWQGYTIYTSRQTRTFTRHQWNWETLLFKRDGKQMAMTAVDNVIQLWEVDTNNLLRTYIGHTDDVWSIDITDDGRYLVSGSRDGTMRLWDVETGSELHTLSKFVGTIDTVVFSPDGKSVAGLLDFQNSNIVIYDVQTGVHIRSIRAFALPPLGRPWTFLPAEHSHPVNMIAFSPKGDTIASCSDDETVRLWDVNTGKHLRVMIGHTDDVSHVSFSPDGQVLLSSSRDNTIRLWDVETGTEIHQFSGGSEGVRSVTFSPDGNTIVTGEDDSTIRFWNYHNGALLHTFTGHKGSVTGLVFSPDGQTMASRSADGTVLIWDVTNLIPSNTIVSLSPVSMVSPEVSEPLTLFLNITSGQNIAGYQAKIHYDTTALRYVNSANGDYLPANAFFTQPVVDVNNVQLASVAYGQEVDGDGTLASITFEVIAVKNSTVRLSHVLLTDSTGTGETPQTAFAEITEPPIRPEDVNEDGVVDVSDLLFVATNFGKHGTHAADVNTDGEVDVIDLALVASSDR